MKKNERGESGVGFIGWLIIALVVLGLLGIGPCASCLRDCGPQKTQIQGRNV